MTVERRAVSDSDQVQDLVCGALGPQENLNRGHDKWTCVVLR